jgi:flap endonuclease-1
LSNKKLAVDASSVIYQFLSNIRQRDGTPLMDSHGNVTSHLMGILTRSLNLMQENIKLAFCFDGSPPDMKIQERLRRNLIKENALKKLDEATLKKDMKSMVKYAKQTSKLNSDMINEAKELIQALGMPVVQAPSESEAQCASLAKNQDVWGVVSQDADTLLFGAPFLIRNLTVSQKRRLPSGKFIIVKPELIEHQQVLNELNLNQDQLISLAILIGTDYNIQGVPGIGPKRALDLVKKYKTPEAVFKNVKHDFNWQKIYDIFTKMKVKTDYNLEWNPLDKEKVIKLLVDKHDFSLERIEALLSKENKDKKPTKDNSLSKWF